MRDYPEPQPLDASPLSLTNVVKSFGAFRAVDDVSLRIKPGEIFALLGPNGAGKTTLIGCICGLARQTSGEIRVFGYDTVKAFRASRRLVGLVPQEINFDPFFTPRESLLIQSGLMGVRPDRARVDGLLKTLSLWDHRDAYTRTLSGGMKRRLLVAKALVHQPKLLFLDEPTAGVDVELRKDLWTEVERLRSLGTTIILTTHYLEEAERLADRIGVIHRGELLLVRDRAEMMREYGKRRVRVRVAATLSEAPSIAGLDVSLRDPRTIEAGWRTTEELNRLIAAVATAHEIEDIEVGSTSLEEIFVDFIRGANQSSTHQNGDADIAARPSTSTTQSSETTT